MQYTSLVPVASDAILYTYAQGVDVTSDASITRYVGPNDPLQFLPYKPNDLVSVTEAPFIHVQ